VVVLICHLLDVGFVERAHHHHLFVMSSEYQHFINVTNLLLNTGTKTLVVAFVEKNVIFSKLALDCIGH